MTDRTLTRRGFVAGTTGLATGLIFAPAVLRAQDVEIVHWSWLSASDGEVWQQAINAFNDAHAGKGIRIRMELVPEEQYVTRVLAGAATGAAPDFGWGTAGKSANLVRDGVVVAIDAPARAAGLDLTDFDAATLAKVKYPTLGEGHFMVPMDVMSLQPLVNLDHLADSGLSPDAWAADGAGLLKLAEATTRRDGDRITRSGILMTGAGIHPCVTWGIVAAQMGFRRASDDLKTAAINPEAGVRAMEWVLALYDGLKVSTRDITDRYKAFGAGEGTVFWTGPWTLNGYVGQGLKFKAAPMPAIGERPVTYYECGGLELYKQADEGRYARTMEAVRWLSDNSLTWTTVGRGASPRASIRAKPEYNTTGHPALVRGAFLDMSLATEGEIPVIGGSDFTIYSGGNVLAKSLDEVWTGRSKPADVMQRIGEAWQAILDAA
jgi:ABC-type glycerol-3-phosphate transport system substrate-binding protein